MKKLMSFLAVSIFTVSVFAQKTLVNDPAHSRIQFTITHLSINEITGNFNKADLTINADDKDFTKSKFNFTIDANSVNTNVEARDNHLRSEDFFDVAKFPTMNFTSTSITEKQKTKYLLNGNFTMHGVTKPITLQLTYKGSTENPMSKKMTYSYQVKGVLNRSDYGIGPKFPNAMLSDEVYIKGDFEVSEK